MTGYELSRQWFDWANEHPEQNSPTHAGFMFWLIELNNRLGWKEKFGLPTLHTMEVLNIRSYKTYKGIFNDLVEWGFIKLHQKATNNHTANIIQLVLFTNSDTNSDTNSLSISLQSQCQPQDSLTDKLNVDIDKQINLKPKTIKPKTKKKPDSENPDPDFINSIISIFCEEFKQARAIDYVITDEGKERARAGIILATYKKQFPGQDSVETLEGLRVYFHQCLTINEKWHFSKMSLSHISCNINELNAIMQNGNTQGVTEAHYVARKFGKNAPPPDLSNMNYKESLNTTDHGIDK